MTITQGLGIGSTLHGTYRIDSILGQGGFGITYVATDITLQRRVAVKEFFPRDFCDRDGSTSHVTVATQSTYDFVERLKVKFLKEARNIALFDHPGIIKIHAAFEENNTAYYVMDLIDGYSLADLISQVGVMTDRTAVEYINKVGRALQYVHSRNINHLDIKPANIMIRRIDREPVLIDFGLSKQYDQEGHQTSTTPTGISHGFAPMEQYNDGGVSQFSPQTDIYSLAATLYYLVSGTVPPAATLLIEEPLPFGPDFPESLKQPIAKAMSPGRRMRQATVDEFLHDLRTALDSSAPTPAPAQETPAGPETVIVTPEPQPEPLPKPKPEPQPKQKPKSEQKPEPKPLPKPETEIVTGPNPLLKVEPDRKSSGNIAKWAIVAIAGVFILVCGISALIGSSDDTQTDDTPAVAAEQIPGEVTDMKWLSPLGEMIYTGEVDKDRMPHGKGRGEIVSGRYKGNIYEGEFVNGVLQGEAVYHLSDGSEFRGTFKANKYDRGRYTFTDGSYFEGLFIDGEPSKAGVWSSER